jgi:hypothetical protein
MAEWVLGRSGVIAVDLCVRLSLLDDGEEALTVTVEFYVKNFGSKTSPKQGRVDFLPVINQHLPFYLRDQCLTIVEFLDNMCLLHRQTISLSGKEDVCISFTGRFYADTDDRVSICTSSNNRHMNTKLITLNWNYANVTLTRVS